MADKTASSSSSLMDYLPGIYREDPYLGQFLLAFEQVLLGQKNKQVDWANKEEIRGLENIIAGISSLFDPFQAPKEFLPWLASWVAFSLREDVDEKKQREFIANMADLYRWRGTKKNLIRLFEIFTDRKPTLPDIADTTDPHYFKVLLDLSELARGSGQTEEERQQVLARQIEIAHALIRLEKPAHTRYTLDIVFPSFQVGSQSGQTKYFTQVGKNTRLGVAEWRNEHGR